MYNKHLDTFIQVADAGSFTNAAKRLNVSSTAVIKQINLLEAELELTLFERSLKGIKLTKSGQSLYEDSKAIIQYATDAVLRAHQVH